MRKIDTSKWMEFPISTLFDVVKGTRLTKADMRDGETNFIGASAVNNGITAHISNDEHIHPANTITITYNGSVGEAFYQDSPFWASDDVNVLYPKFAMNRYIAFFIIPVLKKAGQKYAFIDKWKKEDMEKDCISLPVDENHQPDFSYMESYMKNREIAVSASLTKLQLAKRFSKADPISTRKWKPFTIGDLFYKLNLKIKKENFNKISDVSTIRTPEFSLPLVNAKHFDNGIMYYGRDCDFESAEMTLDIVKNGAIATGDVYAQPQRTGVLWDAYLIKPFSTITSDDVLLFLATVLEKSIKDKFSYDDKCIWEKVKQLTVMLPVDDECQPDYVYMEKYMQTVEVKACSVINSLLSV